MGTHLHYIRHNFLTCIILILSSIAYFEVMAQEMEMNIVNEETGTGNNTTYSTTEVEDIESGDPADQDIQLVPLDGPPSSISLEPIEQSNEFAGAPPLPGTLRILAEEEAPKSYVIQAGDTLFDICDQLLDEATYWPKLWSMNPSIKNPHFIWPGTVLRFYPGDDLMPPFLQVESDQDLNPLFGDGLDGADLVKAPLPESADEPIYAIDPIEVVDSTQISVNSEDYIFVARPQIEYRHNVVIPAFVYSEEQEELATFVTGLEGQMNMGVSKRGLVELNQDVSVGKRYTMLRYEKELSNPLTGDFVGYKYLNVGSVIVEELIPEDDRAVIKVLTSEFGIQTNDILVNYVSSVRTIDLSNEIVSARTAESTIIDFGNPNSLIGGEGYFVVFDNPSIPAGSNVSLFKATDSFAIKNVDYIPKRLIDVGVAKILDNTDAASLGYILKASSYLSVGDRTTPENIIE